MDDPIHALGTLVCAVQQLVNDFVDLIRELTTEGCPVEIRAEDQCV